MSYSDDEIKKYLNILHNYKNDEVKFTACKGCLKPEDFSEYLGQYICNECGVLKGHIIGNLELKDFDRLHYQKKSIYHRKYYFDKKVKNISKLINLTNEEKSILYDRLIILDSNNINIINKEYNRKRMINVNYLIKKILEEMGCEKYKKIKNKINPKILDIYNNWWEEYKILIK